ncbi:MAG TPA: hypothetical protein K8U77_01235, partial [Slackia equolifaciens]|nr:hypothetical protein [Slackia equolifaciens]
GFPFSRQSPSGSSSRKELSYLTERVRLSMREKAKCSDQLGNQPACLPDSIEKNSNWGLPNKSDASIILSRA